MSFEDVYDKLKEGGIKTTPDISDDVKSQLPVFQMSPDEPLTVIEDENEEDNLDAEVRSRFIGTANNRVLTVNFEHPIIISTSDTVELNKWKKEMKDLNQNVYYDKHNYIYCAAPTFNFTMLRNYFALLNTFSKDWVFYSLFDQGYLPYIYWPSFKLDNDHITFEMKKLTNMVGIDLLPKKNQSLFQRKSTLGPDEYWIHRKDLLRLMDYIESNSDIKFGPRDIDTVSMVQYCDAYARKENAHG